MKIGIYLLIITLTYSCKEGVRNENIVKENIEIVDFINEIGLRRNEQRKKDSLPIIPNEWEVIEVKENKISWAISKDLRRYEGHVLKTVKFNSLKEVTEELDLYFSGNKIKCPGIFESSNDKEFLEISYTYEEKPFADDRWKENSVCCSICEEYYKKFPKIKDDIKRNDSILKKWGINRLNWIDTLSIK